MGADAVARFIEKKRKKLGLSARELARKAGVSGTYITYIEKGVRSPTHGKLMNIIDALDAREEFANRIGSGNVEAARMGRLYHIPVVTWVMAGKWNEVCDAFEPGDADEWIESDVRGKNVFALRVVGDSMEPEFKGGEVIIVNPHLEAAPGDFIVVKKDEEATFKQLKRYGSRWVLHPLNPGYQDQEVKRGEFKIIGRVVKKEKRY